MEMNTPQRTDSSSSGSGGRGTKPIPIPKKLWQTEKYNNEMGMHMRKAKNK